MQFVNNGDIVSTDNVTKGKHPGPPLIYKRNPEGRYKRISKLNLQSMIVKAYPAFARSAGTIANVILRTVYQEDFNPTELILPLGGF